MVEEQPAPVGHHGPLPGSDKILNLFWDLTSLNPDEQSKAAQALVAETMAIQNSQPALDADEVAACFEVEDLLAIFSQSTVYVFKRLIRGLASGRAGARQGFALALTLLLAEIPAIRPPMAVKLIYSLVEPVGMHKGADTRDYLLGKLFGLAAIVRAGSPASASEMALVLDEILDTGSKKSFLRELSTAVALELLASRAAEEVAEVARASEQLQALLHSPLGAAGPESVQLGLAVWPGLSAAELEGMRVLPREAGSPDAGYLTPGSPAAASAATQAARAAFFSAAHLKPLSAVLAASTGNHPRRHNVWDAVLAFLLGAPASAASPVPDASAAALASFWRVVVEEALLNGASEARKYLAFGLLQELAPRLTATTAASALSPATLRELNRHLGAHRTNLSKMATQTRQALLASAAAAEDDARGPAAAVAIRACASRAGGALAKAFGGADAAANGQATAAAGSADAKLAAFARGQAEALLAALSSAPGEDALGEADPAALAAIEALWGLVRQPKSLDLGLQVLKAFAALSMLEPAPEDRKAGGKKQKKKGASVAEKEGAFAAEQVVDRLGACDPEALSTVRRQLAGRVLTGAETLRRRTGGERRQQGGEAAAAEDTAEALVSWLAAVSQASAVRARAATPGGSAEAAAALRGTLAEAPAARVAERKRGRWLEALRRLACTLQLYAWSDESLVEADALADLAAVAQQELVDEGAMDEDAPRWPDTLVGVLLSLLAKDCAPLPSAPLRDAADAMFRVSCHDLTETGLQDMLAVLTCKHASALADEGAEDEEESGDDSDVDESDVDSEAEGGSTSDEDDDEEEEEDEEEDEEEADEGSASDDSDASSSSSDDDMAATDAEMFKMDEKLGAYFATLKRGKGGNTKEAAEQLVQFKQRIATLLEQLYKRAPASPLLPLTAIPLLNALCMCVTPTGSEVLAKRLSALIEQGLVKTKATASGVGAFGGADALAAAFARALRLVSRHPSSTVQRAAGLVTAYLHRAALQAPAELRAVALESLKTAATLLLASRKARLQHKYFAGVLERVPSLAGPTAAAVLDGLAAARNGDHIRLEAALVIQAAVKANSQEAIAAIAERAEQFSAFAVFLCDASAFKQRGKQTDALRALVPVLQAGKAAEVALDWAAIKAKAEASAALESAQVSKNLVAALQAVAAALPAEAPAKSKKQKRK